MQDIKFINIATINYNNGAVHPRGGPAGPQAGGGSVRAAGGNGGRRLAVP